jgi:hypothetical protein
MLKAIFLHKHLYPDVNQEASILIKIVWSVLIIISLSFITNMFIQTTHIFRYSEIIFLMWAVSLTLIFFAKQGYIYFSAFLYVTFLLIMIFAFSWTGGGIKGHGIKVLPVVVLIAGLTLGKREIWFFGIIATLGGFALVWADYVHRIPVNEALGQSPLIYWIYNTTCILLLCFLENLSVEELRKALSKSQKEVELRKRSEELLKLKNEKLLEIAFLQSHLVRRPVASVLGLIGLIKADNPNDPVNLEMIPKLEIAAKELDTVIHEIVQKTAEIESLSSSSEEDIK